MLINNLSPGGAPHLLKHRTLCEDMEEKAPPTIHPTLPSGSRSFYKLLEAQLSADLMEPLESVRVQKQEPVAEPRPLSVCSCKHGLSGSFYDLSDTQGMASWQMSGLGLYKR